jgi:hypothetical protein
MPLRGLASIRNLAEQAKEEEKRVDLAANPSFDRYSNQDYAIRLPHRNQSISHCQSVEKKDIREAPTTPITTEAPPPTRASEANKSRDVALRMPFRQRESLREHGKAQDETEISNKAASTPLATEINDALDNRTHSQLPDAISEWENEGASSTESVSKWTATMKELLTDSILNQQSNVSRRPPDEARFERDIVVGLAAIRDLDGTESSMRPRDELQSVSATESVTDPTYDEKRPSSAGHGSSCNDDGKVRKEEIRRTPRRDGAEDSITSQAQNCLNLMIEYLRHNRELARDDDAVSVISDLTGTTDVFLEEAVVAALRERPDTPPKVPLRIDSVKGSACFQATEALKGHATLERTHEGSTVSSSGTPNSWKGRRKRSVDFSTVQVRFYERIMCDNPACTSGPSVGIGWNYENEVSVNIDRYENSRGRPIRSGLELSLSRERREKLLRDWGYTDRDIASGVRELNRLKSGRRQTVNNLGAERLEEALESLTSKVKKALFFHREQQKLEKKLKRLQPQNKEAQSTCDGVKAESSSESLSVTSTQEPGTAIPPATVTGERVEI